MVLDLGFLQDPQQLGLHGKRQFANFVEEERAAVGEFEAARFVLERAGEGPARMASKPALEQVLGNRAAVHLYERAFLARAAFVDSAGDEFLARAAFALDEHHGLLCV